MGRRWRTLSAALVATAVAAVGAGSAQAGSPVTFFSILPSSTQAGGHPDIQTLVEFENAQDQYGQFPEPNCECQDPKNITVHLPPGVIGVPDAVPRCSDAEFGSIHCSPDSQVGLLEAGVGNEQLGEPGPPFLGQMAVYNLVPHPGQAALLGANVTLLNAPIYFVFYPRTASDYGLNEETVNIPHPALGLHYTNLRIWGVPADPVHQEERQPRGCKQLGGEGCHPGAVATTPLVPFTINPTTCGVTDLHSAVDVLSYDREITHGSAPYPATTGCDQLGFNPSLFAQPTTTSTDTASGLDIDLKVPQDLSPASPSASQIRNSVVTLPPGISINANAADGKEACTDAQARIGTEEEARCPEDSKIGTLSVQTPTLPGPLPGYLYLGAPKPGERYRVLIVADGFNVHVKLPGKVIPDPQTGQLTVAFNDLPQFPFADFNVHIFGAERGTLATGTECGTFPVGSNFTPWNSFLPEQTSTQFFSLGSGPYGSPCPGGTRPFQPMLEAGIVDKTAGLHAPFVLRLTREDGEQNVTGLNVATPPGFTASLKGIPYCPEAAITKLADLDYSGNAERAASSCPDASQVGTVVAGAGAGTRPLYVEGKVYLAGPYKGAPLSFESVVPAVSGPYDLGNVAVRTAVYVDPVTARVSAVSDPFPQIIGGIPLRVRSIQLNLDRQNFALNPTNCDPFSVDTHVFGNEGGDSSHSNRFQVANCASLPYRPKLRLRLNGGTNRLGHPAIHATLTTKGDEANSKTVMVTMPSGEILDNAHLGDVCTRVQFAEEACPSSSVLGSAMATTPLLDQPLEGKAYLRTNPAHAIPDIVVALKGQIDVEVIGRVHSVGGRLRTTFENVPDAPVSRFVLNLKGGSRGLLQNSEPLCGRHRRASVRMIGQNGKTASANIALNPSCGSGGDERRRHGHRKPGRTGGADR